VSVYEVTLSVFTATIEVEAEDEDQAISDALDQFASDVHQYVSVDDVALVDEGDDDDEEEEPSPEEEENEVAK
jgi:hypothetical protein